MCVFVCLFACGFANMVVKSFVWLVVSLLLCCFVVLSLLVCGCRVVLRCVRVVFVVLGCRVVVLPLC